MSALVRRLHEFATNLTPFLVSLVLIMLSVIPIQVPAVGAVAPNLGLIAVVLLDRLPAGPDARDRGSSTRPVQDFLEGGPIGLNGLTLLIVYGAIVFQRVFFRGKSFLVVWWAFGLTAAFAALVFWLASIAWHLRYVDPTPLVLQVVLTLTVFPFLYWLLSRVQRSHRAPREDRRMYRDNERHRLFTRRAAVLAGAKVVVAGVIAGRMTRSR